MTSFLKLFASVAILSLAGGYGFLKLYNNNTQEPDDYENLDDEDETIIEEEEEEESTTLFSKERKTSQRQQKQLLQQLQQHNNNNNHHNHNNNKSSISKNHFIIIENLIYNITTKQNQAIYFRKKYHKNLNEILNQINDMREKICVTEEENLKKIHHLLDEIENYHKRDKDPNSPETLSCIKELENQVIQEEAYLDTELKVLQSDLGMLMWKYGELENYDLKEWKNSQLEIQRLRDKLMEDVTRFSKIN